MTQLELKAHPVWQDLTSIVENIDSDALVREHLEECGYKIYGYWDEQDTYYEEISLPHTLKVDLISSLIGFDRKERFLQLKFSLNVGIDQITLQSHKIGELILVYDENMKFIDESWILDVDSPELEIN